MIPKFKEGDGVIFGPSIKGRIRKVLINNDVVVYCVQTRNGRVMCGVPEKSLKNELV